MWFKFIVPVIKQKKHCRLLIRLDLEFVFDTKL